MLKAPIHHNRFVSSSIHRHDWYSHINCTTCANWVKRNYYSQFQIVSIFNLYLLAFQHKHNQFPCLSAYKLQNQLFINYKRKLKRAHTHTINRRIWLLQRVARIKRALVSIFIHMVIIAPMKIRNYRFIAQINFSLCVRSCLQNMRGARYLNNEKYSGQNEKNVFVENASSAYYLTSVYLIIEYIFVFRFSFVPRLSSLLRWLGACIFWFHNLDTYFCFFFSFLCVGFSATSVL